MPKRIMEMKEMEDLLNRLDVGRLGLCKEDKTYIVPIHYLYKNGNVYFHGKKDGLKMEHIRTNPLVCFEVDELVSLVKASVACKYTSEYRSVIAYGKAKSIEKPEEKKAILNEMVAKYARGYNFEPATIEDIERIAVVEIKIEEMNGKARDRKS